MYLGSSVDLIPPAPDNTEGFWENRKFVEINDKLLLHLKAGWDYSAKFEPDWEKSASLSELRDQASALIAQFNLTSPVWGWKDPRSSLTLPFWSHLIPELKTIICLRNPVEVAASLSKRGFNSTTFGVNLWRAYNERLLESIPPERRLVTHYDSYFIDPVAELRRLVNFSDMPVDDKVISDACSTAKINLKHNWAKFEDIMSLKQSGMLDVVDLYVKMCLDSGEVYWGNLFDKVQDVRPSLKVTPDVLLKYPELIVGLVENSHQLIFSRNKIINEKNKIINDKNVELQKIEVSLRDREFQLNNIFISRSWGLIQKIQKLRLTLMPLGSFQDKSLRLIVKVINVLSQSGIKGLIQKIRDKNLLIDRPLTKVVARKDPVVSIVIPVFNALPLTQKCIRSLYEVGKEIPFELIIVDNASTDGTSNWLKTESRKHSDFRIFTMKENIGFGPAVNHGIRQSQGDFIVILNSDTIVSPLWLTNLLSVMQTDDKIGIVSPVTNFVGEGPQIDEAAKDLTDNPSAVYEYARSIASRVQVTFDPNRLVFFCVALRRELIDVIGYLDEAYEKGNYEDDDYCMRTRIAGYKLAIAHNSFVYHHGSATFKKNRISHNQYMELNRERFYKKAGRIASSQCHFPPRNVDLTTSAVSLVVRTKDRPMLLTKALTSLANQTFSDFEVVLVNDGGEDVSSIIGRFKSHFPIQYIHNTTSVGRTAAVNQGLRKANGGWLSILDDDDIVYPWHLESLYQAAQVSNKKFVYSDYNQVLFLSATHSVPNKIVGFPSKDFSRKDLLVQNYIPIHTWLFARECFESTGEWLPSLDRLEDYEFLLRVSQRYPFQHLKKVTCEYRYYLDSANSIYSDRKKSLDALKHIYQIHPVEDPELLFQRQEVLNILDCQVEVIEAIRQKANMDSFGKMDLTSTREIIRLVVGI